jgi:Zn-dependent metalloprotease
MPGGVVHFGSGIHNAFWSEDCFCVYYGDAGGGTGPFTGMDMVGHELTHAVTRYSAGLIYSGESGGLNEATSDIFGSLVEFYANNPNDPGDYLIGEEFLSMNSPGSSALRYMYRPSLNGSARDCYFSTIGAVGVHNSSGPANHFFYLLAEGSNSTPVSYTCNGSTITGIGRAAAGKIWYRALTVYMTSSTTYAGARQATLDAARDLYGARSTQYQTVAAAWSAVSVDQARDRGSVFAANPGMVRRQR